MSMLDLGVIIVKLALYITLLYLETLPYIRRQPEIEPINEIVEHKGEV